MKGKNIKLLWLSSQENSVRFFICAVCAFLKCPVVAWNQRVPFLSAKIVNTFADITIWRVAVFFGEPSLYSPSFSRQQIGKERAVLRRKVPFVHGLVGDYPGSVDQTSNGDGPSCFERNEKEALFFFCVVSLELKSKLLQQCGYATMLSSLC